MGKVGKRGDQGLPGGRILEDEPECVRWVALRECVYGKFWMAVAGSV